MIAEASAAISGIKVAMDMAKGISALKSETEINQAIIDIQRTLLDAQGAAMGDKRIIEQLYDKIRSLERQMDRSQKWEIERQRYHLVRSDLGAYTYDLIPELVGSEVFHRLCVTCFEEGARAILHTTNRNCGGEIVVCKRCKSELTLKDFESSFESFSTGDRLAGY